MDAALGQGEQFDVGHERLTKNMNFYSFMRSFQYL